MRRPKLAKLARCPRLREVVEAKLELRWSPQQIAAWLKLAYPGDPEMRSSGAEGGPGKRAGRIPAPRPGPTPTCTALTTPRSPPWSSVKAGSFCWSACPRGTPPRPSRAH